MLPPLCSMYAGRSREITNVAMSRLCAAYERPFIIERKLREPRTRSSIRGHLSAVRHARYAAISGSGNNPPTSFPGAPSFNRPHVVLRFPDQEINPPVCDEQGPFLNEPARHAAFSGSAN